MVFPKTIFLYGKICDNEELRKILLTQDYSLLEIFLEKEIDLKLYDKQFHFFTDNSDEKKMIVINTSSSNFDKFSFITKVSLYKTSISPILLK